MRFVNIALAPWVALRFYLAKTVRLIQPVAASLPSGFDAEPGTPVMSLNAFRGSHARNLVTSAGSLLGSTLVGAGLGFIYWWVAARQFPPNAVGLASALISAMSLLGNLAQLGLGTLLVGELPREPQQARAMIASALALAGAFAAGLGILFALLTPLLSPELAVLRTHALNGAMFAGGVALTAIAGVLDGALIGLARPVLQFWRNALFAAARIGILVASGWWLAERTGLALYVTWLGGLILSFAVLVRLRNLTAGPWRLQGSTLKRLGRAAAGHHALNLALQLSPLSMPLLVTTLLSTTANASFYIAWLLGGLLFFASTAFTIALYAAGSGQPAALVRTTRLSLAITLFIGLLANAMLWVLAEPLLHLFGQSYAEQGAGILRLLGLGVFPLIVKDHFVALQRIRRRVTGTALVAAAGGILELGLAAVGARLGGLSGLALGWLLALWIQAMCFAPTLFQFVRDAPTSASAL